MSEEFVSPISKALDMHADVLEEEAVELRAWANLFRHSLAVNVTGEPTEPGPVLLQLSKAESALRLWLITSGCGNGTINPDRVQEAVTAMHAAMNLLARQVQEGE